MVTDHGQLGTSVGYIGWVEWMGGWVGEWYMVGGGVLPQYVRGCRCRAAAVMFLS